MPNPYDLYDVCNPTKETYDAIYNSKLYARIEPGHVARLAHFVAVNAVKDLIDTMIFEQKKDEQLHNPMLRKQCLSKIVLKHEVYDEPQPVDQYLKVKTESLKFNDDLAMLESPVLPVVIPKSAAPVIPVNLAPVASMDNPPGMTPPVLTEPSQTISQPVEQVLNPVETITTESNSNEPTREELYKKGVEDFGMDLGDDKTKAALDAMNIDQLKQEVKWGI